MMIETLSFQRPLAVLILLPLVSLMIYRIREQEGNRLLEITRLLILTTAVLAVANPAITTPEISGQKTITVLQDQSASAKLIREKPLNVPGVKIKERSFAGNNPDQTTKALVAAMEQGSTYLISSDFQLDNQRLADNLEEKNVTLYALKNKMAEEYSVSIDGPKKTYLNAENRFQVNVKSTGENIPVPEVTVEGEKVSLRDSGDNYVFNYTFESEGPKKIKAEISKEDRYSQNNDYYHVVDVKNKPDILYVGKSIQGPHNQLIDQEFSETLPRALENYDTVVTNSDVSSQLSSEIISGQSVLHAGPLKQRNYLPLKPVSQQQDDESTFEMAKVAIVIDISVSNMEDIRNNKAIALNTLDGLSANSQVAIVAYNDKPYLLSDLKTLQNNRKQLKTTIKSIETKGPTDHAVGIKAAEKVLNSTGNIIMITDGGLKTNAPGVENVRERTLRQAAESNLRINVVDSKPSVNQDFLQQIAQLTDGIYSATGTKGPLSFVFDSRKASGSDMITTVDRTHPITRDYSSTVFIDIPSAKERNGAQTLMRSEEGTPFLSVWRYGIGKVAAINAPASDLSKLVSQDPQLLLNTLQWLSAGNEENSTVFEGRRVPESTYITRSADFKGAEQLSRNRYVKTVNFNTTGFKSVAQSITAYNYPVEKQEIGYSSGMRETVQNTGGAVLENPEESVKKIANQGTSNTSLHLENHLLTLLLVLLLIEIGFRKRKRMM